MGLADRILFWGLVVAVSILGGYLARAVACALIPQRMQIAQAALVIALLVIGLSPAIWGISRGFAGMQAAGLSPLAEVAVYVFIIALSVIVLRNLVPALDGGAPFPETDGSADAAAPEPRLRRRLCPDVAAPILRLSSEDHLVEVVTMAGRHKLRMRLVDAIDEMDPVEGYSTHRSHWVSSAAIDRVEWETSQKAWIVLINGDRVPVSRKYRPDLERDGVL